MAQRLNRIRLIVQPAEELKMIDGQAVILDQFHLNRIIFDILNKGNPTLSGVER